MIEGRDDVRGRASLEPYMMLPSKDGATAARFSPCHAHEGLYSTLKRILQISAVGALSPPPMVVMAGRPLKRVHGLQIGFKFRTVLALPIVSARVTYRAIPIRI